MTSALFMVNTSFFMMKPPCLMRESLNHFNSTSFPMVKSPSAPCLHLRRHQQVGGAGHPQQHAAAISVHQQIIVAQQRHVLGIPGGFTKKDGKKMENGRFDHQRWGFTWLGFHMVGVSHGLYNRLTMKKVI